MGIAIAAYEDWGAATGTPAKGTNRVAVADLNLKTARDPLIHYWFQDLQRPVFDVAEAYPIHSVTFTRHISFKLFGTYDRMKNVKITLRKPEVENLLKTTGLSLANFTYKLTNVYQDTPTENNIFGRVNGVYDGTMNALLDEEVLWPRLSTVGPEAATSRPISIGPNLDVWTEYLVLQAIAFPIDYENAQDDSAYKELLGNLMQTKFCTVECDEFGVL